MRSSFQNAPKKQIPGRPFVKGDPRAGRPKGRRSTATLLVEKLMGDDLEAVTRSIIQAAQAGDMTAAKIIMDRMAPVRRGRPVPFNAPDSADATGIAETFKEIVSAMGAGEITPEEGSAIANVLELRRKTIETVEIEQRLKLLEERERK